MSWWKRLWRGGATRLYHERLDAVRLTMQGWKEYGISDGFRIWRDPQGDVLSYTVADESLNLPDISDYTALVRWSRDLAESRGGGLIEVRVVTETRGAAVHFIYKRLQKPEYSFTGMLFVPIQETSDVWTVVAREHGMTGVREAVITTELFNEGKLTIEDYQRSWAQDPYDPAYRGVDQSVLCFVSDDESYDERFPEHPLSKVRQVLTTLLYSVQFELQAPKL